jgi:hypothetical protein
MSTVRIDPKVKVRLDQVVRRRHCPDCEVEPGSACRVTGTNDEPGRKPGQYRTVSHLGRWKAADRDPVLGPELDRIRVGGLKALWEEITGQVLTEANAERFRTHPAARALARMNLDAVRRAGIICWEASSADVANRALRLAEWGRWAAESIADDRARPASRKAALAEAYEQTAAHPAPTAAATAKPKKRSSAARGCSELTKAGTPCTINPGPSGKCHVHDPTLQCGHLTTKGKCVIPTGGGLCQAHRSNLKDRAV